MSDTLRVDPNKKTKLGSSSRNISYDATRRTANQRVCRTYFKIYSLPQNVMIVRC